MGLLGIPGAGRSRWSCSLTLDVLPLTTVRPVAVVLLGVQTLRFREDFLCQSSRLLSAALESTSRKPERAGQVSGPKHSFPKVQGLSEAEAANPRVNSLSAGHIPGAGSVVE